MSTGTLRCQLCGDVIGMYEPLILLTNHAVRETSRTAEPGLAATAGDHYHSECYSAKLEHQVISAQL